MCGRERFLTRGELMLLARTTYPDQRLHAALEQASTQATPTRTGSGSVPGHDGAEIGAPERSTDLEAVGAVEPFCLAVDQEHDAVD